MTDIDDGTYTAVVDTVEDGLATVFFERDGEEVGSDVVDAAALPAEARHADAVLSARVAEGDVVAWDYDPDRTETRRERAQSRFDRLSRRPPRDDEDGEERSG